MRYLYVNKYVYVISFFAHFSHYKFDFPDNNIKSVLLRRS